MTLGAPAGPLVAIIIPVYKHSVLLGEAVVSVLNQETDFGLVIVIVNDGCPMPETQQACLDFAMAAPNRVFYIRRPNGGLSAARNTGIDYVLDTCETVGAIYFLDADNRLLPGALVRAYQALEQNPAAGWVYPNVDTFGQEWASDYSGDYSVLRHLDENICEAGSLVRREVFAKGARFDETMRLGFEDWEFWLGAITLGFRGNHLDNFGFRYRKRPESMLSNSERDRPEITSYIRRKHKDLFRPGAVMAAEHREAPRYAIYAPDRGDVAMTSDPVADAQVVEAEDFFYRYYRGRAAPTAYARPPFIAVIDPSFREILEGLRLLRWAFWLLEGALDECNFACLVGVPDHDNDRIGVDGISDRAGDDAHRRAGLVMLRTDVLDQCLDDPADSWITGLDSSCPQPQISTLRLSLPNHADEPMPGSATAALLALFQRMRKFQSTICRGQSWNWRQSHLPPRSELFRITRNIFDASPIYPRVPRGDERRLGFILPLAEFGGVEKVAYNLARIARDNGWSTNLLVFGKPTARPFSVITEVFEDVNFLGDPEVGTWDLQNRYMGSHYPSWVTSGRHARALGLLCGLDAVVNFHCAEAHALMAPLHRQGTRTIASLHVTDLTEFDRPSGHTYLALGYEHAYDLFTCCSRQLFDWCHAMGIPEGKLSLLRNAPSYELSPEMLEEALASRRMRGSGPLRVLFLGRFDRQKGLDRVAAIVRSSQELGLPIEWRVVGASLIGDGGAPDLDLPATLIEPPKLTAKELTECYSCADVVLMVSRWEGLPLTVLEAMRLGAVVCATGVGAIAEAVRHNETGFLLPAAGTGAIAHEAVKILQRLSDDRDRLRRVSSAAAETARGWTWENSAKGFLEQLDGLTGCGGP